MGFLKNAYFKLKMKINVINENKEMMRFLDKKRAKIYNNPQSILKRFDDYMLLNGIYPNFNIEKKIKGKIQFAPKILEFYSEAQLENERIFLLDILFAVGYDKDILVEMILDVFNCRTLPRNLWEYGSELYRINNFKYLDNYIDIAIQKRFGMSRQMIVLLLGKSKNEKVIPVLEFLLDDKTVYGHALSSLGMFERNDKVAHIMEQYTNCEVEYIRKIASDYLRKYAS